MEFKSSEDCPNGFVAQLCLLWRFALDTARSLHLTCNIKLDKEYNELILPTKTYDFLNDFSCEHITSDFHFGNTLIHEPSGLMNDIYPRYQLMYEACFKPEMEGTTFVHGYKLCYKSFISGASGMSNAFCNIFGMLDIDIESEKGVQLQNIMTAFIIRTSLHSREESEYSMLLAKEMYQKHPQCYFKTELKMEMLKLREVAI